MKKVLGKTELPGAPIGERIMVRPAPPDDTTDGGIIIPEVAQLRPFTGTIVSAGLKALDKMYDNGVELGDTVWWGKFAGVIEEWDHLTSEGTPKFAHDGPHSWSRLPNPGDRMAAWKCALCNAERLVEPIIVIMVDDILVSENLQRRLDHGGAVVKRGKTADNATQFYIETADTTEDLTVPQGHNIGTKDSTRLPYDLLPKPAAPRFSGGEQ